MTQIPSGKNLVLRGVVDFYLYRELGWIKRILNLVYNCRRSI